MTEKRPALPTLRCPNCGHSDLLMRPSGDARCGRCLRVWTRDQLVRTAGVAGLGWDQEVKEGR
jgi:hypothetical protein